MKILRLKSENVMRLVAVDITPEGHLITIGGKNGAGKSSVLKSIAMALGGEKLVPDEPLRIGEAEGSVEVTIGDLIVTRKFRREKQQDGSWGETTSTLTVSNAAGARYPSPQAMLDRLLGRLTFDPLEFANDKDPKRQLATLRALAGVDTTEIDNTYKIAYTSRALANKTYEIKSAQLLKMVTHKGVPTDEISMTEIEAELKAAEDLREIAERDARDFESAKSKLTQHAAEIQRQQRMVDHLKTQLSEAETALKELEDAKAATESAAQQADERHRLSRTAVPNMADLRAKISHAERTNSQIRDNAKYAAAAAEVDKAGADAKEQDRLVKQAEEDKRQMIASAKFPVDGLGLTEEYVTFGGIPFSQASTAEQIRVSVAIGMALNSKLKVLLIKSGNSLDEDSLAEMAQFAENDGYQIWMEFVTKNADDVSVMIVDGAVQTPNDAPPVVALTPDVGAPVQLPIATVDEPFQLG